MPTAALHLLLLVRSEPGCGWREGHCAGVTAVRTALGLLDAEPDLAVHGVDASLGQFLEHADPDAARRLAAHVEAGRWHLLGAWGRSGGTAAPEILVRQYVAAQSYFRARFGRAASEAALLHAGPHAAGWPEILAACGFARVALADADGATAPFHWQGPGGSRVLAAPAPIRRLDTDPPRPSAAADGLPRACFLDVGCDTPRARAGLERWRAVPGARFTSLARHLEDLEPCARRRGAAAIPVVRPPTVDAPGPDAAGDRVLLRAERTVTILANALNLPQPGVLSAFHARLGAVDGDDAAAGAALHAATRAEGHALARFATEVGTAGRGIAHRLVWNPHPWDAPAAVALPLPPGVRHPVLVDGAGRAVPASLRRGVHPRLDGVVLVPAFGWNVVSLAEEEAGAPRRAVRPAYPERGDTSREPAWRAARRAAEQAEPLVSLPVPAREGPLPALGSFGRLEPPELLLHAFKPAEHGPGLVLRVESTARRPAEAILEFLGNTLHLGRLEPGRLASWRLTRDGTAWTCAPVGALED